MKLKTVNKITNDQRGVTSMVIVMLIMALLTLIVLSMSKNANIEQRQTLDRQLNAQSMQAADAGVSDAFHYINNPPAGTQAPEKKSDCDPLPGAGSGNYFPGKKPILDAENKIEYSCVTYDRTPESLEFSSVSTSKSEVLPIRSSSGNISELTFSWVATDTRGSQSYASCGPNNFPQKYDDDCDAGVLRIELIELDSLSTDNRQDMIDKTYLSYIKPKIVSPFHSGEANYQNASGKPKKQGRTYRAKCTDGGKCTFTIKNIDKKSLLLHLRSYYKANSVTITGKTTASDNPPIKFRGAQVVIDSTGKSNDTTSHIRVRKGFSGVFAEFGVQSSSPVCKRLRITDTVSPGECFN